MARILLVSPASHRPGETLPALDMLPHDVIPVSGADAALSHKGAVDLIVVDGRADLMRARTTCQLLVGAGLCRVLLLVPVVSLPVLTSGWGIDDFVVESATAAEIDARVRLLLESTDKTSAIVSGPLTIDDASYTVTANGRPVDLTYTEFELLKYMVAHEGRVLTREQLLSDVWGYDYFGGTRTVDVHIRRLRAKLGVRLEHYIQTVRNVGYRFSPDRDAVDDGGTP
ncbi:MAG: response regulator transcription factor [Propionibacteriaceae bacterium]|nr:response regulator transcription factor [Propionibacteriaceae bacterium]